MFEGAVAVIVAREGLGISFHSWAEAIPFVEVGDEIWGEMPDGTSECADAVPVPQEGPSAWEAILRPCRD
jgi:hypothetical protein